MTDPEEEEAAEEEKKGTRSLTWADCDDNEEEGKQERQEAEREKEKEGEREEKARGEEESGQEEMIPLEPSPMRLLRQPVESFLCLPCDVSCSVLPEPHYECPVTSGSDFSLRFGPIGVLLFLLGFVLGLLVRGRRTQVVEVSYPAVSRGVATVRNGATRPLRIGECILTSYRVDDVWHERLLVRALTDKSWLIVTPD